MTPHLDYDKVLTQLSQPPTHNSGFPEQDISPEQILYTSKYEISAQPTYGHLESGGRIRTVHTVVALYLIMLLLLRIIVYFETDKQINCVYIFFYVYIMGTRFAATTLGFYARASQVFT